MPTWLSWIFYAGALFGAAVTIVATLYFRKAMGLANGHLAIGAGFTIMCVCVGYLVGNHEPLPVTIGVTAVGAGAYLLLRWGRRRARNVETFMKAMDEAKAKLAQQQSAD